MKQTQHLENLIEIRSIMEHSSRFISLSGLSGVLAGIFALIGATVAFWYFNYEFYTPELFNQIFDYKGYPLPDFLIFLFADAGLVFVFSLFFAIVLTTRKAKKSGHEIWSKAVKQMLVALIIPVVTGGIFCVVLLFYGAIFLIAPATLIFYGLALLNASKYTLNDIKYLGIIEILLGLTACFIPGYSLLIWAIGFGVFHVLYGIIMYYKYEKQ